jgi:hypothetical protein
MQLNTETAYAFLYAAQYCNCLRISVCSSILKQINAFLYAGQYWNCLCISDCSAILQLSMAFLYSAQCLNYRYLAPATMHFCMQCNIGNIDVSVYVAQYWKYRYPFVLKLILEVPTPFICGAILELPIHFSMQRNTRIANAAAVSMQCNAWTSDAFLFAVQY